MAKSSSSSSSSSTSSSSSSHSSGTSHRKGARMERRHRKGLKKHRHGKHFQHPHHQYDYLPHHHHHHGSPNHYVNKDDHHFPSPPAPEFPQCAYHVGRIIRSKSLEKKPKIKKARKLHRLLLKKTQKLHMHKRCPFTFPPAAGYVSDFIDYGDPLDNRHQPPPGCCLHEAGHGGRHRAGHDGNHHGRTRSTCCRSHGMSPPSHPVQDADHHKALIIKSQVETEKPSTSTIPAQADVPAGTATLAI